MTQSAKAQHQGDYLIHTVNTSVVECVEKYVAYELINYSSTCLGDLVTMNLFIHSPLYLCVSF